MKAVAGGALVAVDFRTGHQVVSVAGKGWCVSQLLLDARMKWNAGYQLFQRNWWIRNRHRHTAKLQPREQGDGRQNRSKENSQQDSTHILDSLRWS